MALPIELNQDGEAAGARVDDPNPAEKSGALPKNAFVIAGKAVATGAATAGAPQIDRLGSSKLIFHL